MTPLALVWAAVCLWTTVSSQSTAESDFIQYLPINTSKTLTCKCPDNTCQAAYWFRSLRGDGSISSFQHLVYHNMAHRIIHGDKVDEKKFKSSRSNLVFSLHINNVTDGDAGLYSCVLRTLSQTELRLGFLLRPGETPPTLPPIKKPKPPEVPKCRCFKSNRQTPKGCGTMVLWPLVGILLGLAVALISTLFYFSRLPKKCRHQFVKKGRFK